MSDIKWIKITTDIFDDEKILLIESLPEADSLIVIWFKLLCLAGKQNNNGIFLLNNRIPYTDKMLATIFRRKEATVKMALETFEQFGMVELVDGVITIPKWGWHQNVEGMEKIREQNRIRKQRQRDREKAAQIACHATSRDCHAIDIDKDIDKELEEDKKENKKENKRESIREKFVKPTLEDVTEYCREKGLNVSAEEFIDYYDSNGWMVGRTHMKDWRATVRRWARNEKKPENKYVTATDRAKADQDAYMQMLSDWATNRGSEDDY